jgi:hypothetical protein
MQHGHRSTWVKKILVFWKPKECIFEEALEQYRLGFDIMSITSLEKHVPSHSLHPFVITKRLDRAQRRAIRRPPLTTRCTVQFAPSPQGPCYIRSIAGGAQALYAFLVTEAISSKALDTPSKVEPRSPPTQRSLSAKAPTRNKRCTHSSPSPHREVGPGNKQCFTYVLTSSIRA